MAYYIVTGPMGLPIPTLDDPGPDYAQNVNESLRLISYHNHDGSVNGGSVIDLSQQACFDDLSLNENNLINVKSLRMLSQPSALVGAQDINCLYVNDNVLGFNNSNGIFVPIVEGTSLVVTGLLTNFSARDISASTSILPTDTYNLINVDTSTNVITINLPIAAAIVPVPAMRLYIIRDISDNAGTNNITLHCATGNTWGDSGSANFVISNNGGYVGIYTDGVSKWYTFTQNIYNSQNLKLVSSVFDQISSTENFTGGTKNFTNAAINKTGSLEISNLGATLFRGMTVTFQDHASGADSLLEMQSDSEQIFRSGSTLTQQSGAVANLSGVSNLHNVVNLYGTFTVIGGEVVLTTANSMNVAAANAIQLNSNRSIVTNNARSIYASTPAGIVTAAAPSGGLTSGLGLGGGSNDYPCFTNSSGVSSPRSRSVWQPLIPLQMFTGWNVGGGNNWEGSNSNVMQITQIPVTHNGATLDSVTVLFCVLGSHSTLSGITFPYIQLWRQSVATNQVTWFANRQFLSSTNPQFYPTPPNVPTYENGSLTQSFTYTCDQNNVIDTTNYVYFLGIRDEIGANAKPGNQYFSIQLNYSNIVDMRFPV